MLSDRTTLDVAHYDKWLSRNDLEDDVRKKWEAEREEARAYERACEEWEPHYNVAIEYPTSKIFVALRDGSMRAKGRLLPAIERNTALSILQAADQSIFDITPTDVPSSFWTLHGINFEASVARNAAQHYCHISFLTEDVLSVFPGNREAVAGIERVGDSYVLIERRGHARVTTRRGRPPYPWDAFHIEVAGLLRRDELPEKKEAAIEYFRSWFEREHAIRASRSVIGDKLKPY
jgi:hypothetical protein